MGPCDCSRLTIPGSLLLEAQLCLPASVTDTVGRLSSSIGCRSIFFAFSCFVCVVSNAKFRADRGGWSTRALAAVTASAPAPCRDMYTATAAAEMGTLGMGLPIEAAHASKEEEAVASKASPPQEAAADASQESGSHRSSGTNWSISPTSQLSSDPDTSLEDTAVAFSLTDIRQRSTRAAAERSPRLVSVLGGLLTLVVAVYQAASAYPALKKAAADEGLSNPRLHAAHAPGAGVSTELQAGEGLSKVAVKRQWLLGAVVVGFSLLLANCLSRLHACIHSLRRWMHPAAPKRLPQRPAFEEELAELYPIEKEASGTQVSVRDSEKITLTAIHKSLQDFRGLHTRTHQSAFNLFFHLAAQSRKREIKFTLYREARDSLHAKVEQGLPLQGLEVAEVLRLQEELRRQYSLMPADVAAVLDEKHLPPELCAQELEFLTRDFKPTLLSLASHTLASLNGDKRFLKALIATQQAEEVPAASWAVADEGNLQEAPSRDADDSNPTDPEEQNNEIEILASQFWMARRTLTDFRRENFPPEVPNLDRCFLPELPLSLFAY